MIGEKKIMSPQYNIQDGSDCVVMYTKEAKVEGLKRGKGNKKDEDQAVHRVLNMALAHDEEKMLKIFFTIY